MRAARSRIGVVAGLALVAVSGLSSIPANANRDGTALVINEVYGAGGNNGALFNADFVELYNPTAAPLSLDGLALHYRSAGGGSGGAPFALSGSVAAKSTYLVQMSNPGANGAALPTPNATASPAFAMAASGGQVALQRGTTIITTSGNTAANTDIVDFFGASGAASFEGAAGPAATVTQSANRTNGADTDANAADFTLAAPTPTPGDGGEPAPLTVTEPADSTGAVGQRIVPIDLAASGGTAPYTWTATGLPAGLSIDPDAGVITGTPTTTGTSTVTVTATDATETTASGSFDITVVEPKEATIAEIQGTGAASPLDGTPVVTEGIVTGVYADPYDTAPGMSNYGGLDGFYLQTPGTGGTTDTTPNASDAVFVYTGNDLPAGVALGDSVEVIGTADEFSSMTQLTNPTVTELAEPLAPASPLVIAYPTTAQGREAQEGMLLAPTDTFTVTNSYAANQYGEIGLATGEEPLRQPTEYVRDDDTEGLASIKADNAARAVSLDDGTSINYLSNGSAQQDFPLPWLTATNAPRVGAQATLHEPVILEYRNNTWKFQPTAPVLDAGTDVVTFEDTRAQNLAPQEVGGDLKIATFNVLNYFTTTGEEWVAAGDGRTCTYYTDRDENRIGNNRCEPNGPRGAATEPSFQRQQAKIVQAINGLGADIVGLEELENSDKMPGSTSRDDAAAALVAALNAAAGAGTWAYVPSPAEASTAEAIAEQDVIRAGFIYKPARVAPVGESDLLLGTTEFTNAREPLAQAFKPAGGTDEQVFAVIVNHFKSKGDSDPEATGDNAETEDTGAFNGDRVRQATRLAAFAEEFGAARGTDRIFLAGDFNSYSQEDPMHVLYEAGFQAVESDQEHDESYSYSGLSGSLDHVLASPAAYAMVTGADIWEINANESVAYQYSRYNYNVTQLFDASTPFAASDHNPEIVGIDIPGFPAAGGGSTTPPPGGSTTTPPSSVPPTTVEVTVPTLKGKRVTIHLTADGRPLTGRILVQAGSKVLTVDIVNGVASVKVRKLLKGATVKKGKVKLELTYVGDSRTAPFQTTVKVKVGKRR